VFKNTSKKGRKKNQKLVTTSAVRRPNRYVDDSAVVREGKFGTRLIDFSIGTRMKTDAAEPLWCHCARCGNACERESALREMKNSKAVNGAVRTASKNERGGSP